MTSETKSSGNKTDVWLFPLFALPLFVATLSTAAANIFGFLFLMVYLASGYSRDWRKVVARVWFWPLVALVAINFIGMLWTQDLTRGIALLVKLKWVLFTLAGATLPWQRKHFILLVKLFLAGITVNALIGGLQVLHLYPWRVPVAEDGPLGYSDRIFLSMTLTSAILWIAYDLKNKVVLSRRFNIALLVIFFLQLMTAGGRSGQLSFVLLMPFALWILYPGRWRLWAMSLGLVGIIGLSLSPHVQSRIQEAKLDLQKYQSGDAETSIGLRLVFWEGALLMIKDHPIIGVGTGDYKMEMARLHQLHLIPDTPNPEFAETTDPHNSYLAYFASLGLTGLLIFLWFLWKVTEEAWQHRNQAVAWFKLTYMGIFLLGSLTSTLIWGFHNSFDLGLIAAIPVLLKSDQS
jgi:O-antigen ligase